MDTIQSHSLSQSAHLPTSPVRKWYTHDVGDNHNDADDEEEGDLYDSSCNVQGVFCDWCPPKKLKYGKTGLGESTLTLT